MLLHDLVQTSRRVAETSGRLAKIELLAGLLARTAPDEIETAIAFLSGGPPQG
ncbi:MAG: ATP-dependent DNA ligase, partial [Gemmatimonadetes bacterium]